MWSKWFLGFEYHMLNICWQRKVCSQKNRLFSFGSSSPCSLFLSFWKTQLVARKMLSGNSHKFKVHRYNLNARGIRYLHAKRKKIKFNLSISVWMFKVSTKPTKNVLFSLSIYLLFSLRFPNLFLVLVGGKKKGGREGRGAEEETCHNNFFLLGIFNIKWDKRQKKMKKMKKKKNLE